MEAVKDAWKLDYSGLALVGVYISRTTITVFNFAKVAPVLRLTHILALPESIWQLSSLQTLNVWGNAITGAIYF
jgi:hypothetical protein